jgi:hypothetical protein
MMKPTSFSNASGIKLQPFVFHKFLKCKKSCELATAKVCSKNCPVGRRSFRLEAKRCEKGSDTNFASKRNKGLVSLVSLRIVTTFSLAERNEHKAKNSETKKFI